MRRILAVVTTVTLIALGTTAIAQDAAPPAPAADAAAAAKDPARLAAARDLMDVTGVSKQLDGMMDAMKGGFAKGANSETSASGKAVSEEFNKNMEKFMAYRNEMMTDIAALYAETFTAEEMKTVADFYRSGTGAKFISMTPTLMQRGATIGMKYSQKVMDEMKNAAPPPAEKK
jgi:uncharacterized protein